ncbi:MAG TPA: nucleotide exchange factor GrpE [Pyrinomonadaceae bacterium]|jgi:molecular chaperone GrpE
MMVSNKEQKSNRIPVRFMDDEGDQAGPDGRKGEDQASGEGELSSDEIGRASIYEDETEVQRRIDRGQEQPTAGGREEADDADTAGGPPRQEMPERREDLHEAAPEPGAAPASQQKAEPSNRPESSSDPKATGPAMAELIATRAELRRVEGERDELREMLARRQADFENYRKRVERERNETYNRMVGDVVTKLLPVLDNLRRALDTEGLLQANESEEFRHFLQGVELIYKQLGDVLQGLGLEPVAAVGQPFDPHVHEAVVTEQTEDYEPDTVMQEIVRGYRLGDKLLRPAMVKVATR